mgnify:CR=1 FL=1
MTNLIRDSQTLVGMLEGGELNEALSGKLQTTLAELNGLSHDDPKRAFKGEVVLKLGLSVAGGMVTINANITSKVPNLPRRSSIYWVTDSGALSTEHPQQNDMFAGPREIGERARA